MLGERLNEVWLPWEERRWPLIVHRLRESRRVSRQSEGTREEGRASCHAFEEL